VAKKSSEQHVAFATKRGANGYVLDGVDGRTATARRFRELYTGMEAELGDLAEAQKAMLARACTLCIWCEDQEAAMAKGEGFNAEVYSTVSNTLRRLMADLGVKATERAPKWPTMQPLLGGPRIRVPTPFDSPFNNPFDSN
jgi:hypothetical protein